MFASDVELGFALFTFWLFLFCVPEATQGLVVVGLRTLNLLLTRVTTSGCMIPRLVLEYLDNCSEYVLASQILMTRVVLNGISHAEWHKSS